MNIWKNDEETGECIVYIIYKKKIWRPFILFMSLHMLSFAQSLSKFFDENFVLSFWIKYENNNTTKKTWMWKWAMQVAFCVINKTIFCRVFLCVYMKFLLISVIQSLSVWRDFYFLMIWFKPKMWIAFIYFILRKICYFTIFFNPCRYVTLPIVYVYIRMNDEKRF